MSVCSSDDNHSTQSTLSTSNSPTKCPYCSWNKKGRRLFNHIVNSHGEHLYSAIGTSKSIKKDLADDCLLHLNMTWTDYKDEDEFKEFPQDYQLDINGCFGCQNTYTTRSRAKAHWKKSEKCHKDHIKNVKKYLDKLEKFQKGQGDKSWIDGMSDKELYAALDRLARWFYRVNNLDIPTLLKHPMNVHVLFPDKFSSLTIQQPLEIKTRKERIEKYKEYSTVLHDLEIWIGRNIVTPYDYCVPRPWNFSNSPDEDGLPPVGFDFNLRKQ